MHAHMYVCVCMLHIIICPMRFVTAIVGIFQSIQCFFSQCRDVHNCLQEAFLGMTSITEELASGHC